MSKMFALINFKELLREENNKGNDKIGNIFYVMSGVIQIVRNSKLIILYYRKFQEL